MTDDRKFTVSVPSDRLWLIDAQIKLTAVEDITVTKINHSLHLRRTRLFPHPASQAPAGEPSDSLRFAGKRGFRCWSLGTSGVRFDGLDECLHQEPPNPIPVNDLREKRIINRTLKTSARERKSIWILANPATAASRNHQGLANPFLRRVAWCVANLRCLFMPCRLRYGLELAAMSRTAQLPAAS
jgi:hypothetical protein